MQILVLNKFFKSEEIMPQISIIMSTARDDFPIIGLPDVHMLQPTIESLKIQKFQNFEFIFCDALYNYRPNLFKGEPFDKEKLGFVVKHIPVEHNSRFNHAFWLGHRRWNICGQLNSCLIHASGELVVRIDDCAEFDSRYLQRIWDEYETGLWLQGMHIRYLEGKPARLNKEYMEKGYEAKLSFTFEPNRDELLKKIYGENGLIRDSRYKLVNEGGGRIIGSEEWFYGYSSFTLEAALKVNGFCELFDGDKSLEDSDMGSRLVTTGYNGKFLLDVKHQVIEHEHMAVSSKIVDTNVKPIKCNWSLYQVNKRKNRWKANSRILSEKDVEFVRSESLKPPCSPTPNFYDSDCRGKMFEMWVKNQPVFDLVEERKFYKD